MRALLVVAALLVAAPAVAVAPGGASSATLADAGSAPARLIIDGATWSCEGVQCSASGGSNQPAPRACRRVAARLGDVTAFTWKGTALTPDQIAACNA